MRSFTRPSRQAAFVPKEAQGIIHGIKTRSYAEAPLLPAPRALPITQQKYRWRNCQDPPHPSGSGLCINRISGAGVVASPVSRSPLHPCCWRQACAVAPHPGRGQLSACGTLPAAGNRVQADTALANGKCRGLPGQHARQGPNRAEGF